MPRARRKPAKHSPDIIAQIARGIPERQQPEVMMPVAFVETAAQDAGCVIRVIREPGKAKRKQRYRLHIIERMAEMGLLTTAEKLAGLDVYDAWCVTQFSPPAIQEIFVDAPRRPDSVAVAQCERMQAYADLIAMVPLMYRDAVRRLACDRLLPQTAAELHRARSGLRVLARIKGY